MPDQSHFLSVQILGIVFSVFLSSTVFFLVKNKRIQEKYSILWFLISGFVLIISVFRDFMEWFSNFIGIYYAPSALFAILISCAYMLLLNTSISISTLKKQNKNLIQEMGLLKLKVEELEKKLRESEEKLSI